MPKKSSKEKNLIVAILVGAAFITAALVYLGFQIGSSKGGDLSVEIEKGIKDYVCAQQQAAKEAAQPSGPVDVSEDDDAVLGDEDAPVTIVEFSDYQCPFCARFVSQTLPQIKANYIETGQVKLVYRDFPLPSHPQAGPAAEAAECVREQEGDVAYFEFHDLIFENQTAINPDNLVAWASNMGVDILDCLESGKYKDEVQQDYLAGQQAGVRGTPAFFVNGQPISGAQPYAVFQQAIEQALAE